MKGRRLYSNPFSGTTPPSNCRLPVSRWVWSTEWCCSTCPSTSWTPTPTTWSVSPPLRTPWWCSGGRVCRKVNLFNWTDWTTTARSYPSRYAPAQPPPTLTLTSCSLQDLVGPVPIIMSPSCWNDPAHHQGRLHSPHWPDQIRPVSTSQQVNTSSYLSSVCLQLSVCLDHSPFIWFILTYGCVYVNLSLSDFHFSSGREK